MGLRALKKSLASFGDIKNRNTRRTINSNLYKLRIITVVTKKKK